MMKKKKKVKETWGAASLHTSLLHQNFHFAFPHVRYQNLLYCYFLFCLCLISPNSTLLFYPHLFTTSTIQHRSPDTHTSPHHFRISLTFTPDLQPVGLFDPADEGTRTPRNIRNSVKSDTATKYPTTFKSQPLFIGYNSPVCVCVCVTCTVHYLSCTLHISHCRADCNRLMTITTLFWVITQRVVVIPYRRFRTSYRTMRNNPEERSSHLLRGGSLKPRRCDDLEMNSAENSDYEPTHRPFWDAACPYRSPNAIVAQSKN